MKNDKNGFRVVKSGQVYVAAQTLCKHAPRKQTVEIVKSLWNQHPSVKKMRKHINRLTIQVVQTPGKRVNTGTWFNERKQVLINDHSQIDSRTYRGTFLHEVVGHAFWHWAAKYRPEEWTAFNQLVSNLPPMTPYVSRNETSWRTIEDTGFTLYENEQHSAAVEILEDGMETNLNEQEMVALRLAYERLHY